MDNLTYRISTMDVSQADAATHSIAGKYAVDESLFDSLVDQAIGVDAVSAAEERTLKQRLVEATDDDIEHLANIFDGRIVEGQGETIIEFGGGDSEFPMDLNDTDVAAINQTLERVVKHASVTAFVSLLYDTHAEADADGQKTTYARDISLAATDGVKKESTGRSVHYLIRRTPKSVEEMLEVRVAVVGNVDAGKSTMLGVLTQGKLDDGRGLARVALFRHKHEIDSGRTSSVGLEILGFDKLSGAAIRHTPGAHNKMGWDSVCNRSSKLISFLDLAGHEKYLKTTVFGMAGGAPDYVMLMVAANAGLTGMAREHLGLALALGIPVFVVITKIDMCPAGVLDSTLKQLTKVLRSSGCRKLPIAVRGRREVVMAAERFVNQRVCPVFQISNVTGEGVDNLQTFLNILQVNRSYAVTHDSTSTSNEQENSQSQMHQQLRYEISEIFSVPYVGTVVSGVVNSGTMVAGQTVWMGPDFHGNFIPVVLKTIHRKRVEVQSACAGQSVSIALKRISRSQVRKGMVLLGRTRGDVEVEQPQVSMTFEAEVVVLYHSTTITRRYQAMVHCGSVHQTARVLSIRQADESKGSLLRTGDRAKVLFQFIRHPEYVLPNSRLIFREGRTKGVGKVLRVLNKQEEREAISAATNGTMVFDHRAIKIKMEALRHQSGPAAASATKAAFDASISANSKKIKKQ
ncbi:hypothetical protein GGI15_001364 [Coemansia interrupta]|uniref:Tr-type G domain-containing protein n=1 Tax=Coemansia interrupta TaxID=1126814 RepID=A0A9W8HLE6_9FUNG|nr:hypothetical protein GGI15_001364 [Coemansia interrupta]